MLRIPTSTKDADKVAGELSKRFSKEIQSGNLIIKPIHSKGKSGSIKKELKRATKLSMKKNVIIIVVGGLSAGFRFAENIKKNIRFVFETYKIKSSAVQGLIGRCCGYHDNIPTIWADKSVLNEYIRMHNDAENYVPGSKASTHTKSRENVYHFIPCEFDVQHNTTDREELENLLGIKHIQDYRYSQTSKGPNFPAQWKESFSDEPNYRDITWASRNQEPKPYHILINTDEGVSRVIKKTGDKETRVRYTDTTSTSFFSDGQYTKESK